MTNELFAGQVFDHMMNLCSLFGVRQVFGILTSYDEWRVCWLPDDESNERNELAVAESLPEVQVFETSTEAKTGSSEVATKNGGPALVSPSKHIPAHHCRVANDESDVVEEGGEEVDRDLFGSAIWKRKDADDATRRVEGIIRVVTPATYLWKHMKLEQGLQWDKYPRQGIERFYVWDDLRYGIDGHALLAATAGGAVCVLKFFFPNAQDVDIQTKAEWELELWHHIYPEYKEHVRVVKLVGRHVLMMPHFASPSRTSDVIEGVRKALHESFDTRGLVHGDVNWRNIGLRHHGQPLLYDLGHIEKKDIGQHNDWIEKACESLKRQS